MRERNLRLKKVVASKQLRLAVETEEERRARLENDAAWVSYRIFGLGGESIGASMKRGNVRGGGWGYPPPWPTPPPPPLDKLNASHQGCI